MAASLIRVCEAAGMARPHILFWGHEPRPATGWTDPERVGSYVYNTATGHGLGWRVPDAPFVMETSAWATTDRLRVPEGCGRRSSPCRYRLGMLLRRHGGSGCTG